MKISYKHIIFTVILVLNSFIVFSQIYFNKSIDIGGGEAGLGVIATDTGYVICSSGQKNGMQGICISYLNLFGDTLYNKWFKKPANSIYPGWGGCLKRGFNNKMIVGASVRKPDLISYGALYVFNEFGDTLWTKTYGNGIEDYIFYQVRQTSDSGFICVGTMNDGSSIEALLIKTDSIGNIEWENNYGGNNTEYGTTVIQTNDGGYLIGGMSNSLSCNGGYDSWVVKTNSVGSQQWSKCYGGIENDANSILGHQYPDGDYVFVGGRNYDWADWYKNSVTRIKSNNVVEWYKELGAFESDAILQSMKVLTNGDIVAVGSRFPYGVIMRVNENGDSLWYYTYEFGSTLINNLWDVDTTADGGFVAVGMTYNGSQNVWIIKMDKYGCLEPNCWYSPYQEQPFYLAGMNEPDDFGVFNLFPNPNNGTFAVQYELKLSYPISFCIFNAIGQKVYTEILQNGIVNKQLDLELPNGIYEWSLNGETHQYKNGKLVILR